MGDWSDADGGASWGRSGGSFGSSSSLFGSRSRSSSSLFGSRSTHHSPSGSSEGGEIIGGLIGLYLLGMFATLIPPNIVDMIVKVLIGLILFGSAYAIWLILEPLSREPFIWHEHFERLTPKVHLFIWGSLLGGAGLFLLPSELSSWALLPTLIGSFFGQRLSILALNLIVVTFHFFVYSVIGIHFFGLIN